MIFRGARVSPRRLAIGYLCIGFVVSLYQNIFGELTALAWTGSYKGYMILLFSGLLFSR